MTKREYLNSLTFDRDFLKEELQKLQKGGIYFWWHGEKYSRLQATQNLKVIEADLAKIAADKTYKPWK